MATKSPGIPAAPVINSGLMSNHEQFHVVYDGPALDEHRMNICDLAPALAAIADLFSAANTELNGNSADVRVEVKGNFKSGSFQIELIFTQALLFNCATCLPARPRRQCPTLQPSWRWSVLSAAAV
ncbi:MAG TPA: hypothetical protein VGP09_08150 [Caballeronia sp.]|nr:hypothetical protein [Caballeronia sp.]